MAAGDNELILAELLCARLCHDLAGPVGAVATGGELLLDEEGAGEVARDALTLLTDSAAAAAVRLRFLRLALGSGGTAVPPRQVRQLCSELLAQDMGGGAAISLEWHDAIAQPGNIVPPRLLLNLVLLARDCLPRGGAIRVEVRPDGPSLTIIAEGPQAAPGDAAAALSAEVAEGLTPRGAQGYLTARLADRAGLSLRAVTETGRMLFIVAPR